MSEHLTAGLGKKHFGADDFEPVQYHTGDVSAPLVRWRQCIQQASLRGWEEVQKHADEVMQLVAQPKVGHPVRILRFADDMLLEAQDMKAAKIAGTALRELLTPAGMLLKATFEDAVRDVRKQPAEWLGLRFRLAGGKFQVRLGENAFTKLGRRFLVAHAKSRPAERAGEVLRHWVAQLGPCYRWEDRDEVHRRAFEMAVAHGLATGSKFLGTFAVPEACKVAVFSGESGRRTINETLQRIVRSKDEDPKKCGIHCGFTRPQCSRRSGRCGSMRAATSASGSGRCGWHRA